MRPDHRAVVERPCDRRFPDVAREADGDRPLRTGEVLRLHRPHPPDEIGRRALHRTREALRGEPLSDDAHRYGRSLVASMRLTSASTLRS